MKVITDHSMKIPSQCYIRPLSIEVISYITVTAMYRVT